MSTGGLNDDLVDLKARLAACNSYHGRTGDDVLQMAITEANVNYQNPSGDSLTGVGAKSFLGRPVLGRSAWASPCSMASRSSTSGARSKGNELGYISGDGTTKRPSYYHFQMMAQNFRGDWVSAADNNQANVKTFAAQDVDQIAVMIMNQDQSSSFNYTVRLNTSAVSGVKPLKINVDAGVAVEYNGTISTESSVVLIFDAAGTIKKKIEYKLNGHADSGLSPAVTNY